jgi:hypothetical protein
MIEYRSLSPAPQPEACLDRPYPSSQKGGTLIVEEILDLEAHERRLEDPDSYRPACCRRCGAKMHIHDLRPRCLRSHPALSTEVIRFRCVDREHCGAVWQILPAFLARHLWRTWPTVEAAIDDPEPSKVPERTRRRWKVRLASTGRKLIAVLTTAVDPMWSELVGVLGLDASRCDLVRGYRAHLRPRPGACLAELAGLIHRLSPGIRLM